MVALRSRRLETLFGVPLNRLEASHLQVLVTSSTQESFDLDYKRDLYGRGDSDRRKLAGDVAALANTAGGVIILGIEEDEQACATGAPGVALSDAETARIRQVVAALVAPVPMFDIVSIPTSAGEGIPSDVSPDTAVGFIVIAVPRSPQAPHAVLVNDTLRYPKRNGATTRYLSEPEVAAAYQDRLASREARIHRIEVVEREAIERLDAASLPWVVVSLVPDLPGDFMISQSVYRQFQQEILKTRAGLFTDSVYMRAGIGRRRLLASGTGDRKSLARWASLELHSDGSGVYGVQVADLAERQRREWMGTATENEEPFVRLVDDESIVVGILSGLLTLAQHARDRAAAGGGVQVRAQLHPISTQHPTQIGHTRSFGGARGDYPVTSPPQPAETSASLDDLATAGPDLIAVACRLVDELGQAFGVAELGQLSPDGAIRRRYWNHVLQTAVSSWAEANAIRITDDTLE